MKRSLCGIAVLAFVGLIAPASLAQDKAEGDRRAAEKPAAEKPDDRGPEQAMMQAWMKLAAPGEHHEHLKPLAGKWEIAGKWRMGPEAPWQESRSTAEAEWILGGRFLQQKVKGEPMPPMPEPFEGLGIVGYDNAKQRYVSFWIDNFGTMMLTAEGSCSDDGRKITFEGSYDDPMTGSKQTLKTIYKVKSADEYVMEMWQNGPDGKEFLGVELLHKRVK